VEPEGRHEHRPAVTVVAGIDGTLGLVLGRRADGLLRS